MHELNRNVLLPPSQVTASSCIRFSDELKMRHFCETEIKHDMPFHTRLQFSYPGTKPCDEAEQESSLEESSQLGVTEKENFVKEEGLRVFF